MNENPLRNLKALHLQVVGNLNGLVSYWFGRKRQYLYNKSHVQEKFGGLSQKRKRTTSFDPSKIWKLFGQVVEAVTKFYGLKEDLSFEIEDFLSILGSNVDKSVEMDVIGSLIKHPSLMPPGEKRGVVIRLTTHASGHVLPHFLSKSTVNVTRDTDTRWEIIVKEEPYLKCMPQPRVKYEGPLMGVLHFVCNTYRHLNQNVKRMIHNMVHQNTS